MTVDINSLIGRDFGVASVTIPSTSKIVKGITSDTTSDLAGSDLAGLAEVDDAKVEKFNREDQERQLSIEKGLDVRPLFEQAWDAFSDGTYAVELTGGNWRRNDKGNMVLTLRWEADVDLHLQGRDIDTLRFNTYFTNSYALPEVIRLVKALGLEDKVEYSESDPVVTLMRSLVKNGGKHKPIEVALCKKEVNGYKSYEITYPSSTKGNVVKEDGIEF